CPTGIDTMSVFVATKDIKDCKDKIILDIKKNASPDIITIEDGIALIAVVGRGMANRTNIAARLFTAIGYNNIPIKMIDQGSCGTNIIIGVSEDDYQKTLEVIYNEFIG
ncbi:MAG: aspartate kinase, partial [Clostridia bacterium]|nr:aspartate kinase [Clostridia bacterium]